MRFHHVGLVVESIEKYENNMIFQEKVTHVFDPIQNANLALYRNFGDSYLELIEPINSQAYTYNFLKSANTNFHHICYEIENEAAMEAIATENKLMKFKGPLKAVLFNNRNVYFYFSKNKQIIEFLMSI